MEDLDKLPFSRDVKQSLKELKAVHDIPIEGYLLWLAEKQGPLLLERKALQENNVQLYKQECTQEAQSLPRHILNAGTLYAQLTSNELGMEDALKHLENMSIPIAIFLLFAGEGYVVDRLVPKAKAYCKMFPSVVASLPEPYNEIGKALADDPTR